MRHITLVACSDAYDNSPGFILDGTSLDADDMMADREGTLLAHDLLEHQNGPREIGSVWDELEALGAIWQVRGRHGYLRPNAFHPPHVDIASDLDRMLPEFISCHRYGGPGPLTAGTRPHIHDADFLATIEEARASIPKNHERDHYTQEDVDVFMELALRRMRIGFRKAERRFGTGYAGLALFQAVQKATSRAVSDIQCGGQRFRLSYGNGKAHICELDIND
jgi:hypothetical protein